MNQSNWTNPFTSTPNCILIIITFCTCTIFIVTDTVNNFLQTNLLLTINRFLINIIILTLNTFISVRSQWFVLIAIGIKITWIICDRTGIFSCIKFYFWRINTFWSCWCNDSCTNGVICRLLIFKNMTIREWVENSLLYTSIVSIVKRNSNSLSSITSLINQSNIRNSHSTRNWCLIIISTTRFTTKIQILILFSYIDCEVLCHWKWRKTTYGINFLWKSFSCRIFTSNKSWKHIITHIIYVRLVSSSCIVKI